MSIHVCKCEHNGRTEYHLRYPGMTEKEAQALADRINGGELVGAGHPVRENSARWQWLTRHASLGFDGAPSWNAVVRLPVFDSEDQTITALVDRARAAVGAA